MAKNKSKRKVSVVKKTVIKALLETAPYLPASSMPCEPFLQRVDIFRVAYYEWLNQLQNLST